MHSSAKRSWIRLATISAISLLIASVSGCVKRVPTEIYEGEASFYAMKYHGKKTASGERYNMYAYTAAHQSLPFGSKVRVINLKNGRSVLVRINDRGPFCKNRIIDVSWAAAKKLKFIREGTTLVKLEILDCHKSD
jgi:rare lipoprotein A